MQSTHKPVEIFFITNFNSRRMIQAIPVTKETTIADITQIIADKMCQGNRELIVGFINKKLYKTNSDTHILDIVEETGNNDFFFGHKIPEDLKLIRNGTPESVDTKNQYRIWFSNNPNQAIPPLHKITLEESIKNNPQCQTSLLICKKNLSEDTQIQMTNWGKQVNCLIVDIDEIQTYDKIDAIILEIAKQEVKYWIEFPHTGNPGIASDYLRLLLVDKGVYLDCDFYVFSNVPIEVKMPHGCFAHPNGMFLNNDLLSFASITGKKILSIIKREFIKNYFDLKEDLDIEKLNVSDVSLEIQKKATILNGINKENLSKYVLNLAGPEALERCLNMFTITDLLDRNSYFNNWQSKEFINCVQQDMSAGYQPYFSQSRSTLSWEKGSTINSSPELTKSQENILKEYRAVLIDENNKKLKSNTNYIGTSGTLFSDKTKLPEFEKHNIENEPVKNIKK